MPTEHGYGLAQSFKHHRIYACVLAGGKSRRMGRDKALLTHQNVSLLERCLNTLRLFPFKDIFVSRGDHDMVQGVADIYKTDIYENSGPVGGVFSICEHAGLVTGDYLLVLPVDMPNVSFDLIAYLLSQIPSNNSTSSAYYFENVFFPFVVQFDQTLHTHLRQRLIANKTASIKGFLADYRAQALQVPSHENLENLNTPQDWRAFVADKV